MIHHILFYVAIGLRTAAMVFAAVFVVRYWRLPWRSTAEGRHLMSFSAVVAATLLFATVNQIIAQPYPGEILLAVLLFAWIAYEMWRRNRLLTRARHDQGRVPR